MQRLKELNQLSKEEAERIQILRYCRNSSFRGFKQKGTIVVSVVDIDAIHCN